MREKESLVRPLKYSISYTLLLHGEKSLCPEVIPLVLQAESSTKQELFDDK